jgi:hypothetical protein
MSRNKKSDRGEDGWEDIDPVEQAKIVRDDPSLAVPDYYLEASRLLNDWVWVTSLERFVSTADVSVQRKLVAFNENYAHLKLPRALVNRPNGPAAEFLAPSKFIRQYNRETNVVDRIEPMILSDKRVVDDERGLKVFNTSPPPMRPPENYEPGDPVRFQEFLLWLLNRDEGHYDHVVKWMAHVVFHPELRMNHGVLIAGGQNIGKGTLGTLMKLLVGSGAKTITPKQLKEDFNPWVLETRLVVIDEIKEAGNYDIYNRIKVNFTEDTVQVNIKNISQFEIGNYANYMMFSNFPIPLNVEQDDRRVFYVYSSVKPKPQDYYAELYHYFSGDGLWDIWFYLRDEVLPSVKVPHEDQIGGFKFDPPPKTQDHQEMVHGGLHPVEAFLEERLYTGEGIFQREVFFEKRDLMAVLHEEPSLSNALKNTTEVNGILKKLGFVVLRKTVNEHKAEFAFFDRNGWRVQMEDLFSLGDPELRKKSLAPFFTGSRSARYGFRAYPKGFE